MKSKVKTKSAAAARGSAPMRHRVLIVDDDAAMVEIMQSFLKEWYEIAVAHTAEEAVKRCAEYAPHIVLMDLMMPSATSYEGDEAIRLLARDPRTAKIPIIIQTGFTGSRALNLKVLGPGVKEVLTKPVNLNTLKKKIEDILGEKAGG